MTTPATAAPMPLLAGSEHRGPLATALGKTWAPRRRLSERYYETHSSDFDELLRLYTASRQLRDAWQSGWGENVAMGWSVLQNLVADSFFQNPEPVILPLTAAREEEARMLTDIGRTWHETAGTENNVMRARVLCGLQGGAVIWIDEEASYQDALALDEETGAPVVNTHVQCAECGGMRPKYPTTECPSCASADSMDTGEPVLGEDDQPEPLYELGEDGEPLQEPTQQEFTQSLLSLHDWRVDPDGRRWDHKDHKWVERRYERSLRDFEEDQAFSDLAKKMLRTWAKSRRFQKRRWTADRDNSETDPALLMIECGEIWSMVHGKIIHMPVEAEFHLEGATEETRDGFPMPPFWFKSKMYPCVLFAYKWHPPDRYGQMSTGYYPIPDLRLVKDRLKNLNRLEGLILNLCTQQTTKHFYPDGLMDSKVQRRVSSDVPRELIAVDYLGVAKKLADKGVSVPNLEGMIVTLKVDQREQLVKHFEAFNHEVDLIRETLSQGPAQRGGVVDSHTATGQLQVGQALERRLDIEGEQTSGYIDGLTERFFMLLQNRQSLPVYYKDTSSKVGAFRTFVVNQEFRSLRFSFSHRTGSARGIDRELLRGQIREAITSAIPVVQDPTVVQELLKKLFETFDDPTLADVFQGDLSGLAEQAAAALQAAESGAITLDAAGPALLEFLSMFINAHLTQAGIDRVVQQAGGAPPELPSGERTASAAKPKSAGKRAFDQASGLAGAGRVGGTAT